MFSIGSTVLAWSIAGAFGTLMMDLLGAQARRLKLAHGVPPPLITKWIIGAMQGRVFVGDIRTLPGEPGPLALMLSIHYLIGIALALFLGLGAELLGYGVSPAAAFFYGIATTAAAAFFMFPAMGFGILGINAPREWMVLRSALVGHSFYGLGLAIAAAFIGG